MLSPGSQEIANPLLEQIARLLMCVCSLYEIFGSHRNDQVAAKVGVASITPLPTINIISGVLKHFVQSL